ncbi:TonB-dependent receptor [Gallaecimonas mangrovi]|uniref:TonB-dependent receptor n=1 Tax=Gallaecimonas mangrovi TaxID=2291597 RepID=UPI000E207871|nr:TonB-dependent receptor [Gallaecimonas mangrovi]
MKTAPLFAMTALALCAQSWADSQVQGQLIDAAGHNVAGATISLAASAYHTTTDENGRFVLPSVKAGHYQLQIHYPGIAREKRSIEVVDNQPLNLPLTLTGDIEHISVVGQAASLGRALGLQKNADNIVTAASADGIGQYPDDNATEALQRLPGISIERDQGEGRFVRIRGLAPDLNTVTYNGANIPAPESGRRAVALDVIPSDLLGSLEVSKSLTPDMDANSLGGNVEMKSLTAFDHDGRFFSLGVAGSYNQLRDKTSPKASIAYSDTYDVGSDVEALGIALAGSYYDRKFASDNVETQGAWDGNNLEETDMRDYTIERKRKGLAANLDFRPSDSQQFYLRGLYSEFKDHETRQSFSSEWDDAVSAGESASADLTRSLKDRIEDQTITSLSVGGQSSWDDWTLKYQLSDSTAEEKLPFGIKDAKFEYTSNVSYQSGDKPVVYGDSDIYDASNYRLSKIKMYDHDTTDHNKTVRADVIRHLERGSVSLDIQGGMKFGQRKKKMDENVYSYKGIDGTLADFTSGNADYSLATFGPTISVSAVESAISGLDKADYIDELDSTIDDYHVKEDNSAAYLMGTGHWDKLLLVGGLRYEKTQRDTRGYSAFESEDDAIDATEYHKDEDQWLPSLNLRYNLSEQTLLRAAYSNSFVRPTYDQLAPGMYREGDAGDYEAEFGNPELESMTSANYDLSLEHYSGDIGVASIGVFYKDIKNFIYQADKAGSSGYEDYDKALTYINGDTADLYGVELNYVTRLSALPAPFNNMLVSLNGTWTNSSATISWDGGSRDIPFPSQSDKTANFAIGYDDGTLSLRLSAAYQSRYLLEVDNVEDSAYDLYADAHLQWDFIGKWSATKNLQIAFKALNINDEPYYVYTGRSDLNAQYETYGRTFELGLQYHAF